MNNSDSPAMPCQVTEQYHIDQSQVPVGTPTLRERNVVSVGLTKREMMAMHILSAMNGNPMPWLEAGVKGVDMAKIAIGVADALLAELERTKCQS